MNPPEIQETVVEDNKVLTGDISLIKLKLEKEIEFKAGQFIQTIIQINNKKIRRSFSIASSPKDREHIDLLVKSVNDGLITPLLLKIKKGEKLAIHGPFGFFRIIQPYPEEIIFIAAGVGVAPFRSMINDLLENEIDSKITLIFGFRTEKEYLLKNEWISLEEKHKNFKILPVISRPKKRTQIFKGHVTDLIPKILKYSENLDFYICGPPIMISDTIKVLESLGFNKKQIRIERWQ